MPESSDRLREEAAAFLAERFGVPASALAGTTFFETTDGEIWISSLGAACELHTRRPPGLRALRRTPSGLKPTSALLVALGAAVTASRVAVDRGALRDLLLGRRCPCSGADGYVALAYEGDVLGCGAVQAGLVRTLIPTGRRRELLDVLESADTPEATEL